MIIRCAAPGCGKKLAPSTGARPRKFCDSTCRSRAHRSKGADAGGESEEESRPAALSLAAIVRRDLESAGRLETFAGQQALAIAEQMVAPGTRSSFATLNKELTRAMSEAMAGAKPREPDRLDDLATRRALKVASA
jgi:hypothetical protein